MILPKHPLLSSAEFESLSEKCRITAKCRITEESNEIWRLVKIWQPWPFALYFCIFMESLSCFRENGFTPTTVWLKINALKIQFIKITLSGSLTLLDFLIPLLVSSLQASSPGMSWGYFLDKPSPISCTEPDFILSFLHVPGFHGWLQGWLGNLLEIKGNCAMLHFSFASSAAKIISRTAFWDDRISFKYQLASLCISGGKTTPRHMAGSHAAGNGMHFNWLDYYKSMAPLLCLAEGLLPLVVCMCSKWKPLNAWRVSRFIFRKGLEATPLIPTLPPAHGR